MKVIKQFLAISRDQFFIMFFIVATILVASAHAKLIGNVPSLNILPVFFGAIISMTALDVNFSIQLNMSRRKLTFFILILSVIQAALITASLIIVNQLFNMTVSAMYFDVVTIQDFSFLFGLFILLFNWFTLFMLIIKETEDITRYFKFFALWLVEVIAVTLVASLYSLIIYNINLNQVVADTLLIIVFIGLLVFETYHLYRLLGRLDFVSKIDLSSPLRKNK